MKASRWIIAAATLACAQPVQAAIGDPEVVIYRFPGVRDDGGAVNVGVATVFHCTNFSGVNETIRMVTRSLNGGIILSNFTFNVSHLFTVTLSTHNTAAYTDTSMATGAVNSGSTAVAATSINVVCTAMTIDASSATPSGVPLHGIRFSPVPGTQE
jgi:hypothetical protein